MSTQPKPFLTPEQYLAIERAAERKSEYFRGEMYAMSGVTMRHDRIAAQLLFLLSLHLRRFGCAVDTLDLRGARISGLTACPPHKPDSSCRNPICQHGTLRPHLQGPCVPNDPQPA